MRFSFSNSSGERARVGFAFLGLFLGCKEGTGIDLILVVVGTDEGQVGGIEEHDDGDSCKGEGNSRDDVGWKGGAS